MDNYRKCIVSVILVLTLGCITLPQPTSTDCGIFGNPAEDSAPIRIVKCCLATSLLLPVVALAAAGGPSATLISPGRSGSYIAWGK
jgi:hypothetical protein